MAGYFEDEALSAAAFDDEGYYHTGDLATIDDEGFLRILGRKRDVFNSAEGSNIYPARIEELLEGLPGVAQAILIGDARAFISALVVVRDPPAGNELLLAPEQHAAIYDAIGRQIAGVNARLEGFERVRRIAIFSGPFDGALYRAVGQGKIARDRPKVLAQHAELIAALYADAGARYAVPTA